MESCSLPLFHLLPSVHVRTIQDMHVVFMAAASGDCGVSALSPLPTSHYRLSWESQSPPTVSPINIPAGRPKLLGSLGAETPLSTPGRHRDGWMRRIRKSGERGGEVKFLIACMIRKGHGGVQVDA